MQNNIDSIDKDEFHIMDLLKVIWNAKYYIISLMMIGSTTSFLYFHNLPPKYVSYIELNGYDLSPISSQKGLLMEMKTIAFDTKTFNKWRSQRGETTLNFEFISPNYTVGNFTYRKQTHEMSVLLRESRDDTLKLGFSEPIFQITHSSDLPDIYMEVHDYMSYVNNLLYNKTKIEAKSLLLRYNQKYPNSLNSLQASEVIFNLDKFVQKAELETELFFLSLPTYPNKVSVSPFKYLFFVSTVCFLVATLLVLFKESLKRVV